MGSFVVGEPKMVRPVGPRNMGSLWPSCRQAFRKSVRPEGGAASHHRSAGGSANPPNQPLNGGGRLPFGPGGG